MVKKEMVIHRDGFNVVFAKTFCTTAETFESEIRVVWEVKNIISDAKSILGVMAMEVRKGTAVILTTDGPDERDALQTLAGLLEDYENAPQ